MPLFLTTGAKAVLEMNLSPKLVFSDGSTGLFKEIVYEEGAPPPPKLPTFFWVEIDNYTGPSIITPKN